MSIPQAATGYQEGDRSLDALEFQILRTASSHPRTLWELLSTVDGTIRDIYAACRRLQQKGWLLWHNNRIQTAKLPQEIARAFRVDFRALEQKLRKLSAHAPKPTTDYFQEPIIPEDVVRRVSFVWERGDLFQREILVLGDDDLFSLVAALTRLPRRIVVADIDDRVITFIQQTATQLKLPIEAFVYNVAEPLPQGLRRQFDVFLMDPVETLKGFSAWLSRGLSGLRHPGVVYFGLTELECPIRYWYRFERLLLESGLALTDILRGFSRYRNASLSDPEKWTRSKLVREAPFPARAEEQNYWYRSSFCRAVTTRVPRGPITGRVQFGRNFYTTPYTMTLE